MNILKSTSASEWVTATWSTLVLQRTNTTESIISTRSIYHPRSYLAGDLHAITYTTNDPVPKPERNDIIDNNFVQIVFCILYSTVFVLGVFGNVLVCYIVLRNRAMQTVTNIFILNLALSDILLCALAVPFTPLYTFMGRWAFGRTLCHLVPFAQGCSIYISTLTLTSIAIDRYLVIIYPFHPRMKLSTCIAIIVCIWVISLLATLPYGMYVKVFSEDNLQSNTLSEETNLTFQLNFTSSVNITQVVSANNNILPGETYATSKCYCEENWPSERYRKVFGSVTTILQFVLPFTVICICYIWISIKLNARAKAKLGSKSTRKEEVDRDRKRRTNRMLICMVGVFGLSWLPINLVNIFDDFYVNSNEWPFYTLLFFVAHSIAMSSTCYNPFLYAWLNENFRKEFKHVLPCFNPSNNNMINFINLRSDRNTCGPRLHHYVTGTAIRGSSLDNYEDDGNAITQDTCITKDKIIPREPTCGNDKNTLSLYRQTCINASLVQSNEQVEVLLKESAIKYQQRHQNNINIDSNDKQTIDINETCFITSANATAASVMEATTTYRQSLQQ